MIYYSVVLDGMWEKPLNIGVHWEKENPNSLEWWALNVEFSYPHCTLIRG